jgi:hypothetical protein
MDLPFLDYRLNIDAREYHVGYPGWVFIQIALSTRIRATFYLIFNKICEIF